MWYKNIKKSSPLFNAPKGFGYLDVGHDIQHTGEDVKLWFIDTSFNIHIAKDEPYHSKWKEFRDYFFKEKVLCNGRFEKRTNICSCVFARNIKAKGWRMDYITKKVVVILDHTFENPKVTIN